ncbi:MAG: EutN/CcmL family microcompartment protein [Planctomycetes bacterium]|nr:EutN/CcmL family microcompartment protein [Planctomycetota bacterium]
MLLGIVRGSMYSTIQHGFYRGKRVLLVDLAGADWSPSGKYLLAVDTVDAGVGDKVLVLDEGNGARQILRDANGPVRSVIVGIVDAVSSYGKED